VILLEMQLQAMTLSRSHNFVGAHRAVKFRVFNHFGSGGFRLHCWFRSTMLQMLQYPFSKGSIHIPALKPGQSRVTVEDKPIIDPKYYLGGGGEIDFGIMVAAQKFGAKITATAPLSGIIRKRVFPPEAPSQQEEE
jgi:hypothetical protein